MKIKQLVVAGAVALALTTPALAQDSSAAYSDVARSAESSYRLRASDLLGMDVENAAGDEIGEVEDLILGHDNSALAVISVGGFLGLGEKRVSIPYEELKFSADREHVLYDASEEQLRSLPEFTYMEGEERWNERFRERLSDGIVAAREKVSDMTGNAADSVENAAENTGEAVQQTAANAAESVDEATDDAAEAVAETTENAVEATQETADDVTDAGVWDRIAGNWKQLKGKAKQQWGDLTDDQLTVMEGKRDVMVGEIQNAYGISKQEAEQQVDDWAHSM